MQNGKSCCATSAENSSYIAKWLENIRKKRFHHEAHEGHEGLNDIVFRLRALRDLRGLMTD